MAKKARPGENGKTPSVDGGAAGGGDRRLSAEEAELWAETMAEIEPLSKQDRDHDQDAPTAGAVRAKPRPSSAGAETPPPPSLPDLAPGRTPGLDKRTAQRLRRGQLKVEANLDLHGLTQDEAHGALVDFLISAHQAGKRCVLVVTGKGLTPRGESGVLRTMLPRWLNTPPLRERVLALQSAQPRHGGGGAFYVMLKRLR
ncbi:MAG: Smr/MutS family protein [Alphaproteobacteria bacterium]